jgi:hypothetical protein
VEILFVREAVLPICLYAFRTDLAAGPASEVGEVVGLVLRVVSRALQLDMNPLILELFDQSLTVHLQAHYAVFRVAYALFADRPVCGCVYTLCDRELVKHGLRSKTGWSLALLAD